MKNEFIKVYKIDWIKPDNIQVREICLKKELISLFEEKKDDRAIIKDYLVELTVMYNGCWNQFYSKLSFKEFKRLMLEEEIEENNNNFIEVFHPNYEQYKPSIFLHKKYVFHFSKVLDEETYYKEEKIISIKPNDYPVKVIAVSGANEYLFYSKLKFEEFKKLMIGWKDKEVEKKVKTNNKFKMLDIE